MLTDWKPPMAHPEYIPGFFFATHVPDPHEFTCADGEAYIAHLSRRWPGVVFKLTANRPGGATREAWTKPKCDKCKGTGVIEREEPFTSTVYDDGGMLCHVTGTQRYEARCGCHGLPYEAWMERLRLAEAKSPPPTGNPGGDAVG